MEKMELSELAYPSMRLELISYLEVLSDREYQNQSWVEGNRPNGGYDELDYSIHFLYDDTCLAKNPTSLIGVILINKKEVGAIKGLIDELENIFEKYGTDLSDEEYINKTEWERVIQAARVAKEIIKETLHKSPCQLEL